MSRFDVMIYLGINNDKVTRINIIQAKTRKMKLSTGLEDIEAIMPHNFTGADIYAFTSKAYMNGLNRLKRKLRDRIDEEHQTQQKETGQSLEPLTIREFRKALERTSKEEREVEVALEDFEMALKTVKQSVSEKDLLMYTKFK